jgi:hypothetical protein
MNGNGMGGCTVKGYILDNIANDDTGEIMGHFYGGSSFKGLIGTIRAKCFYTK